MRCSCSSSILYRVAWAMSRKDTHKDTDKNTQAAKLRGEAGGWHRRIEGGRPVKPLPLRRAEGLAPVAPRLRPHQLAWSATRRLVPQRSSDHPGATWTRREW